MRRPTAAALQSTGSDEDLFRALGIRVPEHLKDEPEGPRVAPPADAAAASRHPSQSKDKHDIEDRDPDQPRSSEQNSSDSDDSLQKPPILEAHAPSPVPSSQRASSFTDVGGLLENRSNTPESRSRSTTHHSHGGPTFTQDFATSTPSPTQSRRGSRQQDTAYNPTPSESRRGSRSHGGMLQDIGSLLTPTTSRASSGMDRYYGRRQSDSYIHPPSRHNRPAPTGVMVPMLQHRETPLSLQDPGGLLSRIPESRPNTLRTIVSGGSSHGSPTPQQATSRLGSVDDFELEDLGGILSPDHQPDASAAALERATGRVHRNSAPHAVETPQQSSSTEGEQTGGWDTMDIHDPGGLLGK